MKLSIVERIQLIGLLPGEGNAVTLRIVNDLRNDLSFSEKEIKEAGIKQDVENNRVVWNGACDLVKDVKIGDTARGVIVDALKKMDDEKKLTLAIMPVYERFLQGG